MPVILPAEAYDAWLDRERAGGHGLRELLAPYPADGMAMYEVSTLVNSLQNDTPEVIAPDV